MSKHVKHEYNEMQDIGKANDNIQGLEPKTRSYLCSEKEWKMGKK